MTSQLATLAIQAGETLKKNNLKLVTAESCTGGGLSFWITSIPGSSHWFERGLVTYSDEAKMDLLSVNPKTLATFGAVSEQTVQAMAEGALKKSLADVSIAITGIAGPTGGSPQKPVGMVWIAWAKQDTSIRTQCEVFAGDRDNIRTKTIEKALEGLIHFILHPNEISV